MPRPFIFHQPLVHNASFETTPTQFGHSSAAATSTVSHSPASATVPLGAVEVPWDEVVSSIVSEPKERAAALIMLNRCPLLGTAIPCTVTVHNDKVIELTLATHRTGVLPLDPTTEYFGNTLDRQQRRRVVIPVSTIASIGCDLPNEGVARTGGGLSNHPTWDAFPISAGDETRPQYGHEIVGSPMRALRITIQIHHDPAQRASDWFFVGGDDHTATSKSLRPRHVVLYATAVADAERWRDYLRAVCQGNLTEALGRATWQRLSETVRSDPPLATVLDASAAVGDVTLGGQPMNSQPDDPTTYLKDAEDYLLEEGDVPTCEFLHWHLMQSFGRASRWERPLSPQSQHDTARIRECAGYGLWSPYGHIWLSSVQDEVRREAQERIRARTMHVTDEARDCDMIADVAPWVVLQRPAGGIVHEQMDHSQAMRKEVMWRLSSLRHRQPRRGEHHHPRQPIQAPHDDDEGLSWLDARARFMSPLQYEWFTAQKYLDVEDAMGEIIDTLAQRLSTATGIKF
jgi:hypothetical protein